MRMVPSKRRSSFGANCVRCANELIAPERSEYRDEGQIRHFWHCSEYRNERHVHHVWRCWKCDFCFETIVDTKVMEVPPRLVA
jgi:hypothetical protein